MNPLKRLSLVLLLALLSTVITGCGEEEEKAAPIRVDAELNHAYMRGSQGALSAYTVTATSLVERIHVQSISVNRGSCRVISSSGFEIKAPQPRTLRYGESMRVLASNCNRIMEITVKTDAGDWTFTFD